MKLIFRSISLIALIFFSACSGLSSLPSPGEYIINTTDYGATFEKFPKAQVQESLVARSSIHLREARVGTIPGYDCLGLAKYCSTYLQAPRLPALSTLLNTFGDPLPCVEKALARGGLELVQVDLIDATCWRNHVCPPGVPKPDDLKVIEARARSVGKLANQYPGTEFHVSPALEHDVKEANKVSAMMAAAQRGCPSCRVINSPVSGARNPPLELHGTKASAYSISGDGSSIFDGDNIRSDGNGFEHRIAGSKSTYAWWNELNLRCSGEKSFVPPLKRSNRPDSDQFWQGYLTMQPEMAKPNPPPQCRSVRELSGGEIGKPNAEAYCNGVANDGRGNKPLLILKKSGQRGDKLKILNPAGKEVGCFGYYGPYDKPGLHRWYVGKCSDQKPYQLYKQLGGEWGFATLGGGACLRFNSIRRTGTYR